MLAIASGSAAVHAAGEISRLFTGFAHTVVVQLTLRTLARVRGSVELHRILALARAQIDIIIVDELRAQRTGVAPRVVKVLVFQATPHADFVVPEILCGFSRLRITPTFCFVRIHQGRRTRHGHRFFGVK